MTQQSAQPSRKPTLRERAEGFIDSAKQWPAKAKAYVKDRPLQKTARAAGGLFQTVGAGFDKLTHKAFTQRPMQIYRLARERIAAFREKRTPQYRAFTVAGFTDEALNAHETHLNETRKEAIYLPPVTRTAVSGFFAGFGLSKVGAAAGAGIAGTVGVSAVVAVSSAAAVGGASHLAEVKMQHTAIDSEKKQLNEFRQTIEAARGLAEEQGLADQFDARLKLLTETNRQVQGRGRDGTTTDVAKSFAPNISAEALLREVMSNETAQFIDEHYNPESGVECGLAVTQVTKDFMDKDIADKDDATVRRTGKVGVEDVQCALGKDTPSSSKVPHMRRSAGAQPARQPVQGQSKNKPHGGRYAAPFKPAAVVPVAAVDLASSQRHDADTDTVMAMLDEALAAQAALEAGDAGGAPSVAD